MMHSREASDLLIVSNGPLKLYLLGHCYRERGAFGSFSALCWDGEGVGVLEIET